ncbi:hypothetical protein IQ266_18870 [filamentous cyanobacterium LEGE 11480]|uniref:Uncharacterized protein n=1 Tax=Romeriopsis navalis LEGE 11480 TaxID=2777977 RepID=A0A928Z3S4_9CYAN|nr:hypothetical protein [Romeriopsis navalis]MBE9031801.1 hypothetical protein [Romeriopsis navalis LEGE 11480]
MTFYKALSAVLFITAFVVITHDTAIVDHLFRDKDTTPQTEQKGARSQVNESDKFGD